MINTILKIYDFNLRYAEKLVVDVSGEMMSRGAGLGMENHPTFTLGHLVMGSAHAAEALGFELDAPEGWAELFDRTGPGDPRIPEHGGTHWPSRTMLLEELKRQHARVEFGLGDADASQLAQSVDWRFNAMMPTVGDLVSFLCTTHESSHLGQLAAWRRAMHLPSALAALK
ncbi:MAG: DinB family protein [Planctomycetota bacterium]|jgi:hypothetical protein